LERNAWIKYFFLFLRHFCSKGGEIIPRRFSASEASTEEGLQYHIRCKPGDVAEFVLLPGDPERVQWISSFWDERWEVARHREYVTHTGRYRGVAISATSTGIGGPATAIAVEELLRVGASTFIRVGTTGAIQPRIEVGDLIIASGAVRLDGTSRQYVRVEYPAFAHFEVVLALIEAAESLGARYHVGVVASTDSFYTGQARPGFRQYEQSWMRDLIPDLQRAGVLSFEMEASTLFTLSNIYGARAGAVLAAVASRVKNELVENAGVEDAIRVANEAVRVLYEWDQAKTLRGRAFITPSLFMR
jgi:uridine phosphorylase